MTRLKPALVKKFVDEHYANLYRFALCLARDEAEAADLTQQTYFLLSTRGGQIREMQKAKSWLFTTLRREFYRQRQLSGRFLSIDDDDAPDWETHDAPDDEVFRAADAAIVMEALSTVREVFREPLVLFYLDELSYREIAEILEVPIGTVMSRLSRGKAELRHCLTVTLSEEHRPENVVSLPRSSKAN
ncbi:MAG: sigma-70 family RNA polymerase sigma factor [Verrucomicrobiales bacterium]|nr:sigma-70 family RNA polymerase sigma factor [Verrucomicrobiales bacterium]